jgi:hypothetical protein
MAKNPRTVLDLETLNKLMSPEMQNADRRVIATRLRNQFMRDPELLATFERLIGAHERGLSKVVPTEEEFRSLGWSKDEVMMCPAAVVAAAAATWGAAAAQLKK